MVCTAQGSYYNPNSGYLENRPPVLDDLLRSLRYKGLLKVGCRSFGCWLTKPAAPKAPRLDKLVGPSQCRNGVFWQADDGIYPAKSNIALEQ